MTSPKITNLSKKSKHVEFNLAFFNANGNLIACTSSNTDLKPGAKDMQSGSNMPGLLRSDFAKITSYQAVIYVTEGKKE